MEPKIAQDVARRCLCLEVLFQRYLLEADDEPAEERERARQTWLARTGDLGIDEELLDEERALLERPAGELADDDLDDVHGRASGTLVLLWALGRVPQRPTFATLEQIDEKLAEHGLLGDGSVSSARAAAESAELRSPAELEEARRAYLRTRGKAREVVEPEKVLADVAAHHLTWVLDGAMPFDHDIELG
jgi:hypothetical protein